MNYAGLDDLQELLIHYCPDIPTTAGVQAYLESQHRFRCECSVCAAHRTETDPVAAQMAEWLSQSEAHADIVQVSSQLSAKAYLGVLDEVGGGLVAKPEWWLQSLRMGHDTAVLHSRRLKLALRIAMELIDSPWLGNADKSRVGVMLSSLALELLEIQLSLLGDDHPDVATTRRDIADAVQRMLDKDAGAMREFDAPWAGSTAEVKSFVADQMSQSRKISTKFNTARWYPEAVRLAGPGAHCFG